MTGDGDKKAAIVAAASELFSRFGLEKTTMEDIARASGKGKSSLYYYFQSKQEVFAEVIRTEIQGLKASIRRAVEGVEDPRDRFRIFVQTRLRYLSDKEDRYTTIKDEHLTHYGFIEDLTADYSMWEVSMIRSILETGQRLDLFLVDDVEAHAKAFHFALKSLEYPWATGLGRDEMDRSVEVLVAVLLRGVETR